MAASTCKCGEVVVVRGGVWGGGHLSLRPLRWCHNHLHASCCAAHCSIKTGSLTLPASLLSPMPLQAGLWQPIYPPLVMPILPLLRFALLVIVQPLLRQLIRAALP